MARRPTRKQFQALIEKVIKTLPDKSKDELLDIQARAIGESLLFAVAGQREYADDISKLSHAVNQEFQKRQGKLEKVI